MKINKILLPVVASAMLITGCDDQIMEWGRPNGQGVVTTAEIPLEVKMVLANYSNIKEYSEQYMPSNTLGIGMGASLLTGDDPRRQIAIDNYQMVTFGNAMKMDNMVSNTGSLNTNKLDEVLEVLKENNLKLYGHNFCWYQQAAQTYLKALIAPTFKTESTSNIATLLINGDFESGNIDPWFGWGNNSTREYSADEGPDGSPCIRITNPSDCDDYYFAQLMQDFANPLENGTTYTMRFKARSEQTGGSIQLCVQNTSNGNGGWYKQVPLTTEWNTYEFEYTCSKDDNQRLCINFGKVAGTYFLDDIEFGIKKADPDEGRTNLLVNGSFDENVDNWAAWNGGDCKSWDDAQGNKNPGCMVVVNPESRPSDQWRVQIHSDFLNAVQEGTEFYVSYYIKCESGTGSVRCSTTGTAHYQGDQNVNTDWQRIEWTVTASGEVTGLNFDLAAAANTYYIDDVVVSLDPFNGDAGAKRRSPRKANIIWTFKTAEEKNAILTDALENWIKGMAEYLDSKGIVPAGYDVINEAIADGNGNGVRGLNNVFGGSDTDDDGNKTYDKAPEESAEVNGLQLNWGSNRWYWGYYVPDYGVKAFQFARKYLPAETKLFINDYNLETSPSKLAALINWVKEIDAANGSPIVDGIGSQMHVSISPTDDVDANNEKIAALRAQVDAMFQAMAASGKLVRVTELDIALGTSSPSAAQYKAQADAYRTIFESYKTNVPEAQQSGITLWSVSDAEDEHEYWLNGEVPNLFDAKFLRKWAYKGVCDGIAGEDLGLKYGGDDYKAYYEKQNVSSTVE